MQEDNASSRPELTEMDYNAPFRQDVTSPTTLYAVLFFLVITCVVVAVGIAMA